MATNRKQLSDSCMDTEMESRWQTLHRSAFTYITWLLRMYESRSIK